MKLFGFDIRVNRAPSTSQQDNKYVNVVLQEASGGWGVIKQGDMAGMLRAYSSWAYVFASKNADTVAQLPLRLYVAKTGKEGKALFPTRPLQTKEFSRIKNMPMAVQNPYIAKATTIEEVLVHPSIDLFNEVHYGMSRFDLFQLTCLDLELTGNAYWYLYCDAQGIPTEIYRIPPDRMSVIPGDTMVAGYEYDGVQTVKFGPQEIVHFKMNDPNNIWYGKGPLGAAADAYNLHLSMNRYEQHVFRNMGKPEGAFVLDKEARLTKDEHERLKKELAALYGGSENAGKSAVLLGGVKYETYSFNPREMSYLTGRKVTIEEMANIFGIPKSLITTEDVNLANAVVGEYQYGRYTIGPRCRRLEERLNEQLLALYDPRLFVVFDDILLEDKEFMLKEREIDLRTGVRTINEIRLERGLQEVPWGNVPALSTGTTPYSGKEPVPDSDGAIDDEDKIYRIAKRLTCR